MNKKILAAVLVIIAAFGIYYWSMQKGADDIGEKEEEQTMCAQDLRQCPDGSYVGRIAPSCEFQACPEPKTPIFEDGTLPPDRGEVQEGNTGGGSTAPGAGGVACTMEAKLCPDGSYVGRTGPQCEFAACPGQ